MASTGRGQCGHKIPSVNNRSEVLCSTMVVMSANDNSSDVDRTDVVQDLKPSELTGMMAKGVGTDVVTFPDFADLLDPVVLSDVSQVDLGNLEHPAVTRCSSRLGRYAVTDLEGLGIKSPDLGPLYTPVEVSKIAQYVSSFGAPNYCGAKIVVRSHLNLGVLEFLLADYPNEWIFRGAKYGWPLCRDGSFPLSGVTWPNHSSARSNMKKVLEWVRNEGQKGAIFFLSVLHHWI